jgi:hypothetical protein
VPASATSFQNEIVAASLAHVIGGKVEQAYRRGDLFDKRRRLMQQWATFCTIAPTQERQGRSRHQQDRAASADGRMG